MILAIDIGNTTIAAYAVDVRDGWSYMNIETEGKLPSIHDGSVSMYKENFIELFKKIEINTEAIDKCIISSVVPALSGVVSKALEDILVVKPVILTMEHNELLKLCVKEPHKVGLDRIMDAVGAAAQYELPIITVDMGTATTFNVINENKEFLGGAITAGIRTGLKALSLNTAQLPEITLEKPGNIIGKDTMECMQSGAVYGMAALVDGMIARIKREIGQEATVVMTGGGAEYVHEYCVEEHIYEPYLLVKGMIYLSQK